MYNSTKSLYKPNYSPPPPPPPPPPPGGGGRGGGGGCLQTKGAFL